VILDINMMSLMIEDARRVDELARIQSLIPDVRLVAERLELPASLDDASLDRNAIEDILPLVDGERSVGHIIEESLFPKFTVMRTLYGLAQRGVIKIGDRGEGAQAPTVSPRLDTDRGPAPRPGADHPDPQRASDLPPGPRRRPSRLRLRRHREPAVRRDRQCSPRPGGRPRPGRAA
jgi:hypothetical protein